MADKITEQQAWKQCAEEKRLEAFRSIRTPRFMRWSATGLFLFLIVSIIVLAFVPWQQTVNGIGEVTVLSPMSRPQELKSSIAARIKQWFVREGDLVEQGQPLLELEEIKISYLDKNLVPRLRQKREAFLAKREALQAQVAAFRQELEAVRQAQTFGVPAAARKQDELSQKLRAAQRKVEGAEQAYKVAKLNLERREALYEEGLTSERDFELAQQQYGKTLADLQGSQADVDALQQAVTGAGLNVGEKTSDFLAKQASLASKIAKANQDIATLDSELQELDIKLSNQEARQAQRIVKAPIAGRLVRAEALGPGVTVKESDVLATIMPLSEDRVAALFVNDFNAPLIQINDEVRLQFSGWPALQFSGFPQAAMGTFAGRVILVDAVPDVSNQFRILVAPDTKAIESGEQPWPEPELLRPGIQTSGWVMLRTVPLGYELWRRFNGFPPNLRETTIQKKDKPIAIKSTAVKGAK